jgi:prepilin-type N-terminal cleavage/methylation domain-containing protein
MHLRTSTLKRQGGFTLLEVMIAIFIFTVGILGVAAMQIRAIHGNASGQRLSEQTSRAQDIIEVILEEPYANFVDGGGAPLPTVPVALPNGSCPKNCITRTVVTLPGKPASAKALLVTVTIDWTEAGGRARQLVMNYIKTAALETSYK